MKFRNSLLLVSAAMLLPAAHAGTITYGISVDTSGIVSPSGGYIDLQFNQANSADSLSATASISNFKSTGFTFGSPALTSPGVTGDITAPPVVIPNDQGAANYYTLPVTMWGSSFQFALTLSGPAIGTPAPDGSEFFVFLEDPGFNLLVSPLPSGAVADVIVNPAGTTTPEFSSISSTPEPSTELLAVAGIALVGWRKLRR